MSEDDIRCSNCKENKCAQCFVMSGNNEHQINTEKGKDHENDAAYQFGR